MADSVSGVIHAKRTLVFDRNANFVDTLTTYGLAMKYIITPDNDKTGYNIEVYSSITYDDGMYVSGGQKKLYIEINGIEQAPVVYTRGQYGFASDKLTVDMLNANGTTTDPTVRYKWIYANTYHIDGSNGVNSVTLKARLEHYATGGDSAIVTVNGVVRHWKDTNKNGTYDDGVDELTYTWNDNTCKMSDDMVVFKNSAGNTVSLGPWISSSNWGGWDNPHFFHQFESCETAETIDLTSIPLETAPVISSLVNNNPKSSSATGVSAATDSISWKFTKTGGSDIVSTYVRYKKSTDSTWSSWSNKGAVTSGSITGLSTRTTYNIEVYAANGAGNSNTLSLTVRTKSNAPTLTLETTSISLEQITYKWSSNYDLSSLNYVKGTDSAVSITINSSDKKNGTFTVTKLSPNTSYIVKITGAESLDGVTNNVSKTASTLAKTTITPPNNITHNTGFDITAARPSYPTSPTITTKVKLSFGDYSVSKDLVNGSNSITLTEAEWDKIYKLFGNQNKCTIAVEAVTTGVSSYTDSHTSTINLTGIQKTAHIGDSKKVPRRVQVWVGGPNGTVRRAVLWIGDSNKKPRRTI